MAQQPSTSLYRLTAVAVTAAPGAPIGASASASAGGGGQSPFPPGTTLTNSIETVDNDRASLMLELGIIR